MWNLSCPTQSIETIKMKTRKHTCPECSKTFTRATILKDHLRAHEGTRPYDCGTCGRAFTRRWDLKSHAQIHEKSAPYNCDACGARFQRKRDVLRHQERKKGSRCRIQRIMPNQIDQDVQPAGALAGLKHGASDYDWPRSGFTLGDGSRCALCPLERLENLWIHRELISIGHKLILLRCQYYTWSGFPSLRNHLRIVHDLYLLCAGCEAYIQARRRPNNRSSSVAPECHDEDCSSMDMPIGSLPAGPIRVFTVRLPSEEEESRRKVRVTLLPWQSTKTPKLYDDPKGATARPAVIDLYCDTVSTGQVTIRRTPAPARAWPGLETGPETDWNAWDSALGDLAQSSTPNLEVATRPVMLTNGTLSETTTPFSLSAQERNDQYQHVALQQSTLANTPAISKEPDLSIHDDSSNPRLDLLRVVVDVTKYLRERPPGKVALRLSSCQWTLLECLVARLDEVSKTKPGVTWAHTDALWREYAARSEAFLPVGSEVYDTAFDQIMKPLLNWRRSEAKGGVLWKWVADFEEMTQDRCDSVACPCEGYLEVLRPHDGCVTALHDNVSSVPDPLKHVAGDKVRLMSKCSEHWWQGQCERTGQIGIFVASSCA